MNSFIDTLKITGARYSVFDMGRSCFEMTKKTFEEVTERKKPYPRPFMDRGLVMVVSDAGAVKPDPDLFVFDPIMLPLDEDGMVMMGAMEGYMASIREEAVQRMMGSASVRKQRAGLGNQFSWKPTWGEAFMAQAYFARKQDGKEIPERVFRAAAVLRSRKIEQDVGEDFIWSEELGVPELGLAEMMVLCKRNDGFADALSHAVKASSERVLESLCEFMTHAELPMKVLEALQDRTKMVMTRAPAGHRIYSQLIQCMAHSRDYEAMYPIINDIMDHKLGGNPEILTRMVRYHREFMGEHRAFDIDKVLEPASSDPGGMDVFFSYVRDMMDVEKLQERMLLLDFGRLSPGVKARLRVVMNRR